MPSHVEAAQARAASVRTFSDRPSQRSNPQFGTARSLGTLSVRTIEPVQRDGRQGVLVGGLASVTEVPYEMCDMFGSYDEVVSLDAFDSTLASAPLVEFTCNHGAGGGLPMAHTRNGTLDLSAAKSGDGPTGLAYEAFVDPARSDVANMLSALERGDLAEASFKFRIDSGMWSPDWQQFRIDAVDLDRGDVSAVNFGANPNATTGLRTAPIVVPAARKTLAELVDRYLA